MAPPRVTGWEVMVSEFMLQQTPVVRVLPVWEEWMERWPTLKIWRPNRCPRH